MRLRATILLVLVAVGTGRAERPIQPKKDATHVVVGTIEKLTTAERKFGPDGVMKVYTAELKVAEVDRGEGIKAGDTIPVTWFHVAKRPTRPFPGAYGHDYGIKNQDRVRVYLQKMQGQPYAVIYNREGVEKLAK